MGNSALAILETALRERKLDRTLTTALPPLERTDPGAFVPFDHSGLDALLSGGLPRGHLSEISGPSSSGRTTVLQRVMGAITRRGEIAALIDTCDRLDVASASAAGIDLDRLLWVRGDEGPIDRVIDRAVKALNLVLQSGGFALVAIDLADVPLPVLKRLPFTTWLRVQRIVEGSDTACVLVVPEPLARSAGGLTVRCTGETKWSGRLTGLDTTIRVVSSRRRVQAETVLQALSSDEFTRHCVDSSLR